MPSVRLAKPSNFSFINYWNKTNIKCLIGISYVKIESKEGYRIILTFILLNVGIQWTKSFKPIL